MVIPPTFELGAHAWRIITDTDRTMDDSRHGQTDTRAKVIVLGTALDGTPLLEILAHELVHAMLAELDDTLPDELHETIAYVLSSKLLELLRRNPALVAALVADP